MHQVLGLYILENVVLSKSLLACQIVFGLAQVALKLTVSDVVWASFELRGPVTLRYGLLVDVRPEVAI